ncbi:MAG: molybdenum cofactor biosynthesis protein MoaE [Candidatus Eremiobacteraeota bacterium]|nr:molybdenum cofactor biosynthesis protein MoaE [Candidatus Eremiobacteraeota bacterium]
MTIALVHDAIDTAALARSVGNEACGALATFQGVVRAQSEGRSVTGLFYEAYVPMALAEMERIAAEVRARFIDSHLAMVHRLGELRVGEVSVAVAVAAPHRAEAFEACRYAIDELKRRVPIWKLERYAEGAPAWRENCLHPAESDA